MTARTVELQLPAATAWDRLKTAAASMGKIEEAQENSRSLILKARYGLNPVRLRVSVLSGPSAETSRIDIQGRGQDVLGVASRKVIDKLCAGL
jgi:Mg-chelatase subunit ChlI